MQQVLPSQVPERFWDGEDPLAKRQHAYLRKLGWHEPHRHGRRKHRCTLGKHTDRHRKEFRRYQQEQQLLQTLVDGRLPRELVLRIFTELATSVFPEWRLDCDTLLSITAAKLIGTSPAATHLYPLLEDAISKTIPIRLIGVFDRRETQCPEVIPHLPPYGPNIKYLILPLTLKTRSQYPFELYRTTRGIPSLAARLPHLHTLLLRLRIVHDLQHLDSREQALDTRCSSGYSAQITYRTAIERLIAAVQQAAPGRQRSLRLQFVDERPAPDGKYGTAETAVDERSAGEILARAADVVVVANPPNRPDVEEQHYREWEWNRVGGEGASSSSDEEGGSRPARIPPDVEVITISDDEDGDDWQGGRVIEVIG